MDDQDMTLRIDLQEWCDQNDTNLHALSRKAGIAHSTMYALAKGSQMPGRASMAGLRRATGLTYNDLFD